MKNNILIHFAINDLRNHYKDTLISFLTLTCLSLAFMVITFLSPLIINQRVIEHQNKYGENDYVSQMTMTNDDISQMQLQINNQKLTLQDKSIKYALVYNIGYSLTNDQIECIKNDSSLLAINIKEGIYPTHDNEIAVKETVLKNLGYDILLNQTVDIPYRDANDQYQVSTWKVVGFLENSGSASIIVGNTNAQQATLYISTNGQKIDNAKELSLEKNYDIEREISSSGSLDFFVIVLNFSLFIIGSIILSGLTIASFDNRKNDYALLRGIGATNRQLYFIVFVQALILLVLAIIVSSLIYFAIVYFVKFFLETRISLQFYFQYYTGNIFVITLIAFISYFMPARGACRRALTGTFEAAEFQYFYYRYKKLHNMRPLYLGWRQLVGRKKQMIVKIFLIFIITLLTMNIVGNCIYDNYIQNLQMNNTNSIWLDYTPIGDSSYLPQEIFDVYKDSASEIRYFHVADMSGRGTEYAKVSKVYAYNADIKKEFGLQSEPKPGEIITSRIFLSIDQPQTDLRLFNEIYTAIESVDSESSFVIMNEKDFIKYGDIEHYQNIKIYFDTIQDKTKGLIDFAKKTQYTDDFYWQDGMLLEQYQMNSQYDIFDSFPILSCIIGASFIYVYQLAFEIFKQRETIGTYQLLGLRKFEIWQIYAYKSFFIAIIGLICSIYYHFASYYLNNIEWNIYITFNALLWQIGISLVIIAILIALSLLPLYSILNKEGLENKNIRE